VNESFACQREFPEKGMHGYGIAGSGAFPEGRAFCSGGAAFSFKPAAAVLSARRAGTTASYDAINKYFTICSMPVVSFYILESCLWRTAGRSD